MGRKIKLYKLKFGSGVIVKACLAYPEVSRATGSGRGFGSLPGRPAQPTRKVHVHFTSHVLGTIPTQGTYLAPGPTLGGQALLCSPDSTYPGPACSVMHTPRRTPKTTNSGYVYPTAWSVFSFAIK